MAVLKQSGTTPVEREMLNDVSDERQELVQALGKEEAWQRVKLAGLDRGSCNDAPDKRDSDRLKAEMDSRSPKKAKFSHDFMHDIDNLRFGEEEDTGVSNEAKETNDISIKIVQEIGNREITKEYDDCQVVVDGTIFSCHSFVLLSTSEFFRCQFRSIVKEKKDMTVRLSNMSARTFQLVLDTLYTGENLLTADNIIDVWNAVQQLQIDFLVKLCEDFVLAHLSIDNIAIYKRSADNLHARRVRLGILDFTIKNFSALESTEVLLNFDMGDMKHVVESEDLVVDSEDLVLQAVYAWVNANKNERKKYLADLLQCTQYFAASVSCIAELYQNSLTLNDSRATKMLERATAYKRNNYMHGFWPNAAIYRDCWGYEHVGFYCNTTADQFVYLSLKKNTVINFTDTPPLNAIKLAVVDDELVACKDTQGLIELFIQANNEWLCVKAFQPENRGKLHFMLSHKSNIFVFSREKMIRFDPNDWGRKIQESIYNIASPKYAMSFYDHILVFSWLDKGGTEETAVHAWRRETQTWSHLANLQFAASDMTSFKDDTNAYILDQHGNFLKLINSNPVLFTYLGKLWDVRFNLTGALLFRECLYLFVARLPTIHGLNLKLDQARGVFQDLKLHITGAGASNVVHILKERN